MVSFNFLILKLLNNFMCRDDSLTAAIRKMDASVINREDLEKLVGFITRKKYKGLMKKVKEFAESFPEHTFDEAESFVLLLHVPVHV